MKVGALVFATANGLGYQTRILHKFLKFDKLLIADISNYNHMPLYLEWYDKNSYIKTDGFPKNHEIDEFLVGLDAIWVCENPLNYYLFQRAKELGIKVIQQPNYEFYESEAPHADIIVAPSSWNLDKYLSKGYKSVLWLHLPLDTDNLKLRTITEAKTFFHVAGRPATLDRNGTFTFIEAVKRIPLSVNAKYLLYCQYPNTQIRLAIAQTRIELIENVVSPSELFERGDIMVLPRRYGGQSLIVNESIGCGIPVLMPDINPNNEWLPQDWLIPVSNTTQKFRSKSDVTVYSASPHELAARMIELYQNPAFVERMHLKAVEIRNLLLWENLKDKYQYVLDIS